MFSSVARNVLRDVASTYNATSFFSERVTIAADMLSSCQVRLAALHAEVGYLQLRKIDITDNFENIVEDVEIVKQKIIQSTLQRQQDLVNVETRVLVAQEVYKAKITEAQAVADGIQILASAEANATIAKTSADVTALVSLKAQLGLSEQQVLSYMWLQTISQHPDSRLLINIDGPAVVKV